MQDGGCTCPGDVAKAFGAGADFVMAGGIFAGHDQCGGELIEKNGKKFKMFYGMSSATAMQKHSGKIIYLINAVIKYNISHLWYSNLKYLFEYLVKHKYITDEIW